MASEQLLRCVSLVVLVLTSSAQKCFDLELFTLKEPDTPPVSGCDTGETIPSFELTVQGVQQACQLTTPGDDIADCVVQICDTTEVVVGMVPGSSTNGWMFQARVEGKLLQANETCEEQYDFVEPRCQCAPNLNILDDSLFNGGAGGSKVANHAVFFTVILDEENNDDTALIVGSVCALLVMAAGGGAAFVVRRRRQAETAALTSTPRTKQNWNPKPPGVGLKEVNRIYKEEFREFIKSVAFSGSVVIRQGHASVQSYKQSVSSEDAERLSFIKAQSERYSTALGSRYTASMRSENSSINRLSVVLYDKAREVIEEVCSRTEVKADDRYSTDPFRTEQVPQMALNAYLYHLVKSLDRWFYDDPGLVLGVGVRSLLISLIYLKKIKSRVEDFRLTLFNQHRIFAVTMLIAAKFTEDCIIVNKYWADVSGMELEDLNQLETQFCSTCGFELYVKDEQVQQIYEEYDLGRIAGTPRNFISQRFSKVPEEV